MIKFLRTRRARWRAEAAMADIERLNRLYNPRTGHCCATCAAGPGMDAASDRLDVALTALDEQDPEWAARFRGYNGLEAASSG